jgi:hypothetical protein
MKSWRSVLFPVLWTVLLVFGCQWFLWPAGGLRGNSRDLVLDGIACISLTMAWFARRLLIKEGYRWIAVCLGGALVLIYVSSVVLFNRRDYDLIFGPLFYATLAIAAGAYPLAIYLQRRKRSSAK